VTPFIDVSRRDFSMEAAQSSSARSNSSSFTEEFYPTVMVNPMPSR
jgi:hypothetical protein